MTHKESKAPSLNSDDKDDNSAHVNNGRRPRTSEDFFNFCTYVLDYVKYDSQFRQEENHGNSRTTPPLDSSGSSVNSESVCSSHDDKATDEETDVETERGTENNEDSYDLVTCYCRKPFAGRPMIECSRCLTWVHLSCARIRRTHIPEVFYCALCKHNKLRAPRAEPVHPGAASPPHSPAMKRMKRGASL